MLQYNKNFIKVFRKINRRFFNFGDVFLAEKYHSFFKRATKHDIEKYFSDSQQFVTNLIHHIRNKEGGKNSWSRYFIDITVLLCSGMDTDLRTHSIDNKRTSVDVTNLDLNIIFEDLTRLKELAQKENPNLVCLVVPTDFTLLYNVGDYVLVGVDISNRKLIRPHIYEAKRRNVRESVYKHRVDEQKQRERRQRQRMLLQRIRYDAATQTPRLNNFYKYVTFFVGSNKLRKFLNKTEKEYRVDDTFSFYITKKEKIKINKDEWCVDFLDEIFCGGVIPSIFRHVSLKDIDFLMRQNTHIFLKARKSLLRQGLLAVKSIKSVDKHPSPYHSFIHFENLRFSIANTIHAKYPSRILIPTLEESIGAINSIHRRDKKETS